MGQHLDFDKEVELSIPHGIDLEAIMVDVEVIPKESACEIYGLMADGHSAHLTLQGGHSQVRLPFAHRTVYLKYINHATEVRISTIGHIVRLYPNRH